MSRTNARLAIEAPLPASPVLCSKTYSSQTLCHGTRGPPERPYAPERGEGDPQPVSPGQDQAATEGGSEWERGRAKTGHTEKAEAFGKVLTTLSLTWRPRVPPVRGPFTLFDPKTMEPLTAPRPGSGTSGDPSARPLPPASLSRRQTGSTWRDGMGRRPHQDGVSRLWGPHLSVPEPSTLYSRERGPCSQGPVRPVPWCPGGCVARGAAPGLPGALWVQKRPVLPALTAHSVHHKNHRFKADPHRVNGARLRAGHGLCAQRNGRWSRPSAMS